jgi:hypothetical protein
VLRKFRQNVLLDGQAEYRTCHRDPLPVSSMTGAWSPLVRGTYFPPPSAYLSQDIQFIIPDIPGAWAMSYSLDEGSILFSSANDGDGFAIVQVGIRFLSLHHHLRRCKDIGCWALLGSHGDGGYEIPGRFPFAMTDYPRRQDASGRTMQPPRSGANALTPSMDE